MKRLAVVLLFITTAAFAQDKKFTVLRAGPVGELASIGEANEIRVVFSAPMVAIGKIPKKAFRMMANHPESSTTTEYLTERYRHPSYRSVFVVVGNGC